MKNSTLKKFAVLRAALMRERANVVARLAELNTALGGSVSPATIETPETPAPPRGKPGGKPKRKISAAGRAAIAAAARARWARARAAQAKPKPAAAARPAPKAKGRLSAAGRAKIIAATKAYWAKKKAAEAKGKAAK